MRIVLTFVVFIVHLAGAQTRKQPDAAHIRLELKKLNSLGSVLYLAAHPDDENTRAIAYLVNDRLVTTAYLSLTRGDGGQNLIGPEIRDLLGLIRTQELLSARRIDGGLQFFTRAIDFGYSKTAKETFEIWDKKEILSDVVKVIRQFQPDVIMTRFPPDERAGHGQHTASAVLAQEAFDRSNNPAEFPDQAKDLGIWQVKRLLFNTGRFFSQSINEKTPGILSLNVGAYSALLGKSSSELAAESRTQHKSQGFGSPGRRGDALEFFEQPKGEKAEKDIFEGVNTGWSRLRGGEKIQPLVEKAIRDFNDENPASSVSLLLQIRREIAQLEDGRWKNRKMRAVNSLIQSCLGLFVEVTADNFWVVPGESVTASFEILNRSEGSIKLAGIQSPDLALDTTLSSDLKNNLPLAFKNKKTLSINKNYSTPYWLDLPHSQGIFNVADHHLIGAPENEPSVNFKFTFLVNGEPLIISCPLIYKWTDPVKGELTRPFEVVPPIFLNLTDKVFVFPDPSPKQITVLAKSASEKMLTGSIRLLLPAGWKSEPAFIPVELKKKGEEMPVAFKVFPGLEDITGSVKAVVTLGEKQYDQSIQIIDYDHIPIQTLLPKAEGKVVRLDLKKEGAVVGYIKGAGDEIPSALRNMGYQVWEMKDEEVTAENLKKVDAIVLGVRALNTNDRIRHFMETLIAYVQNGGTMIMQYNTNAGLEIDADKIAPYPIELSRDRVTEEGSEVRILKPDHPALNFPNKITSKDFEGWVQERGLYFPSKWAPQFDALISINDEGETAKDGALLVTKYGSGYYVYTGFSFFRQLPEGVPGAFRLFANLASIGKTKKPENLKVKAKTK